MPSKFRRTVFNALHSLSHPGIRASQRLITERFVWPRINRDVKVWTRACLACQKAKIHHRIKTSLATFAKPDSRFSHIHIDIVGPLPPSEDCKYILTVIDRFTRWPEPIPIPNIETETVAKAFISIYGLRHLVLSQLIEAHNSNPSYLIAFHSCWVLNAFEPPHTIP